MPQNLVCSHDDFRRRWDFACSAGGVPTLWGYALQNLSECERHKDEIEGPFDNEINTLLPYFMGGGCESLVCATAAPTEKSTGQLATISEIVPDNDAQFRRTVPRRLDALCTWYREHLQEPLLKKERVLYVLTVLCDDDALLLDLVRAGASGTISQLFLGTPTVCTKNSDGLRDPVIAEHLVKGPISTYAGKIHCDSAVLRQGNMCLVTLNIEAGKGQRTIGNFLTEAYAWTQSAAAGVPVLIIASLPGWLTQDDVASIKTMLKAPNSNSDCCSRFFEWLNNVRRRPLEMQNHNSGHVMQTTDADTIVVIGTEDTMGAVSVDTVYTDSGGMRRHMIVEVDDSSDGMQASPAGRGGD